MQWSSNDQIWPGSVSSAIEILEPVCSAFLGAGAYHMTMTGKWISFGLPKYLCIARIDFDFAAVASGGFRLGFGFGTRPEIWRALFMGSMNQKKSVKQVYDTFCVWLSASRWHFNLAAIDGNLINLLPDFNWVRPKEKCWAIDGMVWFHLGPNEGHLEH